MFIFSLWRKSNNYTEEPHKMAVFFPTSERSLLEVFNQSKNGKNRKKIEKLEKKIEKIEKLKN
jgi:hypothetical protein